MAQNKHYKAFISYSHVDVAPARWLHRALEAYRIPRRLTGIETRAGVVPPRLHPVFRDRDELASSHDLSEVIRNALRDSETLIVICSPTAARSKWVNQEIEEFKKLGRSDRIFALIVGGDPAQVNTDQDCFPPALRDRYDASGRRIAGVAEPIAADLRESADGRKLARLKILAGLLGVGLDELIQRETQRRHRNLVWISAASAFGMLVMTALSIVALDARNGEQQRRAEAEDLIEFMLSDLRDRLDAVGRLDVLDAVGEKAIEYYSSVDLKEHSEAALGRRARAFLLLGEVDDLEGDIRGARDAFEEAYQSTAELLSRDSDDGDRIFNHAQSVFWVGYLDWRLGDNDSARARFTEYVDLAQRLVTLDPENIDWLAESGHSNINMGVYAYDTGATLDAIGYFETALSVFEEAGRRQPDNLDWQEMTAQSHAWLADANRRRGPLNVSIEHRRTEVGIYRGILDVDPANQAIHSRLVVAGTALGEMLLALGDVDAAINELTRAARYGEELLELDPENTFTAYNNAGVYIVLGDALLGRQDTAGARTMLNRAEDIARDLLGADSDVLEWQLLRIGSAISSQRLALSNGLAQDVIEPLRELISDLEILHSSHPDAVDITYADVEARYLLGEAYIRTESLEDADAQYRRIIENLAPLSDALPLVQTAILLRAHRESRPADDVSRLTGRLEQANFGHPSYR